MALRSLRCRACGKGDEAGKVFMYSSGNYHKDCKPGSVKQQGRVTRYRGRMRGDRFVPDNPGYRACRCEDYPACGH